MRFTLRRKVLYLAYSTQLFVATISGQIVHLTYTERDDDFQVISLRKAEKHEVRNYVKETTR